MDRRAASPPVRAPFARSRDRRRTPHPRAAARPPSRRRRRPCDTALHLPASSGRAPSAGRVPRSSRWERRRIATAAPASSSLFGRRRKTPDRRLRRWRRWDRRHVEGASRPSRIARRAQCCSAMPHVTAIRRPRRIAMRSSGSKPKSSSNSRISGRLCVTAIRSRPPVSSIGFDRAAGRVSRAKPVRIPQCRRTGGGHRSTALQQQRSDARRIAAYRTDTSCVRPHREA